MKSFKSQLNESIKRAKHMNDCEGSVGCAIRELQDKLNDIKNEKDLDEFVIDIKTGIDPDFSEDYEEFVNTYNKQKGFNRKYRYIYNYILAGDDLRA